MKRILFNSVFYGINIETSKFPLPFSCFLSLFTRGYPLFYNVFDAAQVHLTRHISNTSSDAVHNHFIPLFRILSCLAPEDILNSSINKALSFI